MFIRVRVRYIIRRVQTIPTNRIPRHSRKHLIIRTVHTDNRGCRAISATNANNGSHGSRLRTPLYLTERRESAGYGETRSRVGAYCRVDTILHRFDCVRVTNDLNANNNIRVSHVIGIKILIIYIFFLAYTCKSTCTDKQTSMQFWE